MLRNESTLDVDYQIDGEALYRYHSRTIERIVPWGPEASACCRPAARSDQPWQPFTPDLDLPSLEENARNPSNSRSPALLRRVAACRFLIDHWPEEARDRIRAFPSAHWQLLQLVNAAGEPALELPRSNPALGWLAAMAGAANQISSRRRSLAALVGFPETEHAVRLLRKVPTTAISPEFLAQLRAAIADEREADVVLTHLNRINPVALEVARDPDLRASVSPECMVRLSRIPATVAHCDLVARMRDLVEYARDQGLREPRIRSLADLDRRAPTAPPRPEPRVTPLALPAAAACAIPAAAPPPPVVVVPDLNRPVSAIRIRAQAPLEFPEPPLPDLMAPGIRINAIRRPSDLAQEGAAMDHCAGHKSWMRRALNGRVFFYRMLEPERLTIAIRERPLRQAMQGWTIEEIRGPMNRHPTESTLRLVHSWLRNPRPKPTPKPEPAPIDLRQPTPPERRRAPSPNQLAFDFTVC